MPETVKVATLYDPAGPGKVVTVFVPGATEKVCVLGPLTTTSPLPPAPPSLTPPPPAPPPVLTVPLVPAPEGPGAPVPPPPAPPAAGVSVP